MPASGVFALNRSADFRAPVYGVEFLEGGARNALARSLGGRFYFAEEVLLRSGRAASYAVAEIPIAAWEESAPAIAGVKGGPLARLKLGARARAYVYAGGSAHALLVGSVVSIRQDLEADGAAVTILDDRWLLEGVPVAGQFLWDEATQSVLYRPKGPCRFNPRGRPNCLDGPDGPLFAPWPGYGRADGDADPAPGQAAEAARPWRHADICSYLRRAHATALYAAQTAEHSYFTRVDETKLVVPEGFGLELLNDAEADPAGARAAQGYGENDREDASGSARTPDLALEGLDLLAAFSAVVESAGAYALSCAPEGDGGSGRSILEIVPARYVDGTAAARVYRPGAGSALAFVPALSVTGGGLEEDAEDLFTAVAVAGEPARLEVRLAYAASGGGGLEPAWSAADEAAFRAYMAEEAGQPNSRQAFFEAAWKFPRVFAA
ncbi:MAG: hypothetical protein KIS92_26735, partial [Planctomycetota bacterium]|nr:hypothetical protein [Planctomycetota bacterium]